MCGKRFLAVSKLTVRQGGWRLSSNGSFRALRVRERRGEGEQSEEGEVSHGGIRTPTDRGPWA